jgi:hypothetical protein
MVVVNAPSSYDASLPITIVVANNDKRLRLDIGTEEDLGF